MNAGRQVTTNEATRQSLGEALRFTRYGTRWRGLWASVVRGLVLLILWGLGTQAAMALTSTTTALGSSASSTTVGTSVTLTATVSPTAAAGTVTFKDGTTTLGTGTLASGKATLAVSFSTAGSHSLTAVYAGNTTYATSTSSALSETVSKRTTTTVLASSINPAAVAQSTTLTATVTGTNLGGTVTFKDGTTTLGTGTIASGKATFAATFTTAGAHNLTAVYAGDTNNLTSTSTALSQTVSARTTTTALASSVNPAAVAQSTTLTATVTGTSPSGTVTFKDGTTTLGTGTVASGKATFAATFTTAGAHSLTAVYAGDTNNLTSTSSAVSETVNARTTTTVLTASANPTVVAQSTTLTATITGTNPSGTVTFKDGTTTLGTGTVASGVATLATSFATGGTHSLTAVYAGDANNLTSTSSALSETVVGLATTSTLSANPTTAFASQSVVLTATISPSAATGTVTFKDGTTTLGTGTLSSGVATLLSTFSTAGAHSLTAVYAGDTTYATSTSSAVSETINSRAATSTALTSSLNPANVGQSATLTATVTSSSATGTVTFKDGTTTLGTGTLSSGVTTFATTFTTGGTHNLTAVYGGDTGNLTSTSAVLTETVTTKAATTLSLFSYTNPANAGVGVPLWVTITPTNATGTVTFKDGAAVLFTASLQGGSTASQQVVFATPGTHSLTAEYAGDGSRLASTSPVVNQVVTQINSTVALGVSANPAGVGQGLTLSAAVTSSNPTFVATGVVTFKDGATTLGTGTLNAGVTTLQTSFNTGGLHSLTAVYGGDSVFVGSTSSAVNEAVNPIATTTTLASSLNPVKVGQSATLAATVTGVNPTGTVTFKDGTTSLGTGPVTSGVATLATSFASSGTHSLTAVYAGDASNLSSTSAALSETANTGATATSLALAANPGTTALNQAVTLTATVSPAAASGTVTFKDGLNVVGTATLTGGVATSSVTFQTGGTHALSALYSGDAAYAISTANASATVNAGSSTTTLTSSINPAHVGQKTTLAATVAGLNPAFGTMTFVDGTIQLGTATFTGGVVTFDVSFPTAGIHSLTAIYSGDSNNLTSTSNVLAETVNPAGLVSTTTLAITSIPTSAPVGGSYTFTATVSPAAATGTITFKDGTSTVGTANVVAGTATLVTTAINSAGAHSFTAEYSGDTAYSFSISPVNAALISRRSLSNLTVTSSVNPSIPGQTTVFTATATGTNPTGTITFKDEWGTTLCSNTLTGGVASCSAALYGGAHILGAVYSGDANHSGVTYPYTQTVNAGSTTTIVVPSVNPVPVGQNTNFTVTVTGTSAYAGASPTGTVSLTDGSTGLGSVNIISGVGTLATTFFTTGAHTIRVSYAGDASNLPSTSNTLIEAIPAGTTATTSTITVSPTTAMVGQSVVLTATVNNASAKGAVTFKDGAAVIGTAQLNAGVANLTSGFSFGTHSLTAVYAGDENFAGSSSGAVNETVTTAQPSTTTLTSSTPAISVGQSMTLTATVSGWYPTGSVTFKDGTTILGTGFVYNNGGAYQATLITTIATSGSHSLTAVYGGDANSLTSTSSALIETVTAGATTTALSSSVNPVNVAQSTTLTASVTGTSPSGAVTFKDGTTTLGTATLVGGVASLTTSFSSSGVHNLTAVYGGDINNLASTAPVVNESVPGGTPILALSTPQTTISSGQIVTLLATASGASVVGDAVHFYDGATDLGSAVIDASNTASLGVGGWTTGSHAVTAALVDATFVGVVSPAMTLTSVSRVPTLVLSTNRNPTNLPPYGGDALRIGVAVTGMYVPSTAGTVITLRDGGTAIASFSPYTYGSVTSFNYGFTPTLSTLGVHNLTLTIDADNWNAATVSPTLAETVGATTSFDLHFGASPWRAGQASSLSVVIGGGSTSPQPTGTVTFSDGATVIATVPVSTRDVATSYTPPTAGTHILSAAYSGDGGFTNLPSSVTATLNVLPNSTSVSLSTNLTNVAVAAPITLTATLAFTSATGTVSFSDETGTLGTATLSSSSGFPTAILTTSLATPGPHRIMASYGGDSSNAADASNFIVVQVGTSGTASSPGNMTWLYGYDALGSLITAIDPNANATQKFYDNLQRNTTLVQPLPAVGGTPPQIQFGYDGQDNLTSVKDPRNLTTGYTINGLGDTSAIASPDSGGTGNTYDAAGNLKTRTDARGNVSTFSYDVLNRLKSVAYTSGAPTLFEYDGGATPVTNSIGKLSKITDESGTTAFTYDGFGNIATKTSTIVSAAGTKSFTVTYTWGTTGPATGKLVAIKYPSGTVVNYVYDASERLSAVTANPVNANGIGTSGTTVPILSAITYNGSNAIKSWTWSDGTAYQRSFDTLGRLTSYPLGNANGTGASAGLLRTLGYDNAGRITGYTHTRSGAAQPAFDQSFGYDGLDRLIQNVMAATTYGYSYDQTGNRTMRVAGATSYVNAVVPTSNQLATAQSAGSGGSVVTNSYVHDPAGNLTSDGGATYAFSARGRMNGATVAGGSVSYLYNALDQRSSKTGPIGLVPSGAAYYAYDEGGHIIGEYDVNLGPSYETVYIGSMPVAALKQTGAAASSTLQTGVYNVWVDHIYAPRVVTRSSDQAIVWRWDTAEAFGATAPDQNPNALGAFAFNARFPGQVFDAETGIYQNGYRYYDPATGRYKSADPIGLTGGINGYAYGAGSPAMLIDPSGLAVYRSGNEYSDKISVGRDWDVARLSGDNIVGWDSVRIPTVGEDFACPSNGGGDGWGGNWGPKPANGQSPAPNDDFNPLKFAWDNFGPDWMWLVPEAKLATIFAGFWKGLKPFKGKIKTDGKNLFYKDYTHKDLEVFDKRGNHLGSADMTTGEMIKPPIRGRTIEP